MNNHLLMCTACCRNWREEDGTLKREERVSGCYSNFLTKCNPVVATLFYISSFISILATVMAITRYHPVHALLYLAVSFFGVALVFLSLGAPFVAALEIIVYAGAIIVLFIFVVMMLNLGKDTAKQEKEWLRPRVWVPPSILVLVLLIEMVVMLFKSELTFQVSTVDARKVALSLYGQYVIAVELTGFLLMAGIVGAAHIGKHKRKELHRFLREDQANGTGNGRQVEPAAREKIAEH